MISISKKYYLGKSRLSNPIVIASCPATEDQRRLIVCGENGAAAAILKSCKVPDEQHIMMGNRRFSLTARGLWGTSTIDRELLSLRSACCLLKETKAETDMLLFPSIAGFNLNFTPWSKAIEAFEEYEPAGIQLDLFYLGCDLSIPENMTLLSELLHNLTTRTKIPLIAKLNHNIRPGHASKCLENSGLSGWSLLDSILTPYLPYGKERHDGLGLRFVKGVGSASLFGSWQLPITMEYTSSLRRLSNLPILAGGGVHDTCDVQALLSLGASSVQVATRILIEGPRWIQRVLSELSEHDGESLNPGYHMPHFIPVIAEINNALCENCMRCSEQMMCNAIKVEDTKPIVSPLLCEGCGFCVDLCRAGAIALVEVNDIATFTKEGGDK